MNDDSLRTGSQPSPSGRERMDQRCDEFERLFHERLAAQTELPRIEDVLADAPAADREQLLRELLRVELELRRDAKLPCDPDDYRERFANHRRVVDPLVDTTAVAASGDPCSTVPTAAGDVPRAMGHFQIERLLGRGGFAVVYLARDTELNRLVALKVPRLDRLGSEAALKLFLDEARQAAQLDHPGIVRVYSVQRDAAGIGIVQEYIDGVDLATYARQSRLTPRQCAELLIATAEAVGHAHRQGFVHRDLKPPNILIDSRGQPHVADFGLSLHESVQREHAGELAGTYPYMSPEQVRREVNRLDGRSDLWSLGVILYELLAGRRPFGGATLDELLDEILHRDPKPPRMVDPRVPGELSRICLGCLAKRATDRYASTADLIDDLRHWLDGKSEAAATARTSSTIQPPPVASASVTIIPKGLRSYDASDGDFFLELLPGPTDRDGLPKSVRFWKAKLEQRDPDETFPVGLMYGPSGCGKSSLVKAALLPRLTHDVLPLYIEATASDTEVRLIKALKKHCPELPLDASLPALIARLRDSGGSGGRKVVLVLDQFEQWLHAQAARDDSQLIPALRHCDGASVQGLVLVRDDFWMSATRFMQALEVPLVEGHNSAAVDLFDLDHARKVLAILGRGYGKLPAPPAEPTAEQQDFLNQAVSGLADEGKVVCVRLAVFAEMMKGRAWSAASLREVGGTTGVGGTFLEETFSAKTAAPAHRLHQHAVRAVLKALLPEPGTEIKGQMRSYDELLAAAEYQDRRQDFETLLRILDSEVRLITPTEPDGVESGEWRVEGGKERVESGEWRVEGGEENDRAKLQATGGVEVRDGSGGEVLSGDQRVPERGTLRPDKPDPAGGGVDPSQHRRGPGQGTHERVSPPPEHLPRIADGRGNAPDVGPENRPVGAAGIGQPARSDGSDQPHAQRTPQGTRGKTQGLIPPIPATHHSPPATRYFQLTHDYLVPALRDWLTRKQRESRRGRAELRLAERAATWNARPENKQLPTFWEWLSIRRLTDVKKWKPGEAKMMARATRFHLQRAAWAIAAVVLLALGALAAQREVARRQEATRIAGLVGRLVSAEPSQIPAIVQELDTHPAVAATYLSHLLSQPAETVDEKRAQLHARLAAVGRDPSHVEPLVEELLTGRVTYVMPIRQLLRPAAAALTERFRDLLRNEQADAQRRFRAALVLADFVAPSDTAAWSDQDLAFTAAQLVSANAEFQPLLRELLRPIHSRLLPHLQHQFASPQASDAQRLSAANAFADFAAQDAAQLTRLLTLATPEQYAVLFPFVAANPPSAAIQELADATAALPPDDLGSLERVAYGQRRANAAVTLLRLGEHEKVLPVFDMTDDPEALTQFIFRGRARGVTPDQALSLFDLALAQRSEPSRRSPAAPIPNDRALYALLLTLGEYTLAEVPETRRESLLQQLERLYRDDPSSGVHSAAGWLLRHWGQIELARQVDQTPVPYSPDREWFTLAIDVTAPSDSLLGRLFSSSTKKTFYYTFIVFPADGYDIGSVPDEPEREKDELRHPVTLTRPFALLDREITLEELIAFKPYYKEFMQQFDARPADAGFAADWYDSVAFCRWLGERMGLPESDQAYAAPEALDKEKYPREPNPLANWAPRDWPVDVSRRGFRLPTEAEWEVAARSGARTAFGCGGEVGWLTRFGWFVENSGKRMHPPRELRPSVRGLFDLHGNLFEWTHDWFDGAYSAEVATDPLGPERGSYRVYRGGCMVNSAEYCRSANRGGNSPGNRGNIVLGFRVACTVRRSASPEAGQEEEKRAEPADGE